MRRAPRTPSRWQLAADRGQRAEGSGQKLAGRGPRIEQLSP